jgi:hypothetical protein
MPTPIQSSKDNDMRRFPALCWIPAAMLIATIAHAEEYSVTCPPSIESDAVQVLRPPTDWTSTAQGPFWLHSAGPMDGPPADLAGLKESAKTQRVGNANVTTWDLTGTFASGKWMACNYGYTNEFILSKKLDDRTSECVVSSLEKRSGKVEIAIRCKR